MVKIIFNKKSRNNKWNWNNKIFIKKLWKINGRKVFKKW